jgi:hypothetical protein
MRQQLVQYVVPTMKRWQPSTLMQTCIMHSFIYKQCVYACTRHTSRYFRWCYAGPLYLSSIFVLVETRETISKLVKISGKMLETHFSSFRKFAKKKGVYLFFLKFCILMRSNVRNIHEKFRWSSTILELIRNCFLRKMNRSIQRSLTGKYATAHDETNMSELFVFFWNLLSWCRIVSRIFLTIFIKVRQV